MLSEIDNRIFIIDEVTLLVRQKFSGRKISVAVEAEAPGSGFFLSDSATGISNWYDLPKDIETEDSIFKYALEVATDFKFRLLKGGYTVESNLVAPQKADAARRIENDVETIRQEMERMKSLVAKAQSGTPSLTADQMQEALSAVEERVNTRFQSLTQASRTLSAPIEMPPMEELTVRMVTVGTIDRLSEAMQEETKWGTWGGVFLGTLLGILTNIATGGTLDVNGIILVIVLALVAGLCGYTAWGNGKKAKVLKAKLLRDDEPTGKKGVRVMSVEEVGEE